MKWSGREDWVPGRTLELLVVLINMYKNRYGTVLILVSMFVGVEQQRGDEDHDDDDDGMRATVLFSS
jgi:hypothetical protein